MKSVLQDWVMELGLRFQGTLLGAMRGCDLLPKEHVSKKLTRAFRCECLNSSAADGPCTAESVKPASHIEWFSDAELTAIFLEFCRDLDQYPLHYVLHVAHAAEVIGYHLPGGLRRLCWQSLYVTICRKFHMVPESAGECHDRLSASEPEFGRAQE